MKMTPTAVVAGSLIILATIVFVVILLPYVHTSQTAPSEIFRARKAVEDAGRRTYIANGCVYCHSQSIRSVDWGLGAERIATGRRLCGRLPDPAGVPSAPGRTFPRPAASIPTTGTWPISPIRATHGRFPSCPPSPFWDNPKWMN